LVEPYNIFSYTFATMAYGQLAKATGNKEYEQITIATFEKILSKLDNPKDQWNKAHKGTRDLKNFALPMIICNLALEIEHLLGEDFMEKTIDNMINEVMNVFYRPELGLVVENVTFDGKLSDSFDGRLINPGHAIEAMWFIMDLGETSETSGIDTTGNRYCSENAEIRLGRKVWRYFLFYGSQRLSASTTRMGPKTMVGTC